MKLCLARLRTCWQAGGQIESEQADGFTSIGLQPDYQTDRWMDRHTRRQGGRQAAGKQARKQTADTRQAGTRACRGSSVRHKGQTWHHATPNNADDAVQLAPRIVFLSLRVRAFTLRSEHTPNILTVLSL